MTTLVCLRAKQDTIVNGRNGISFVKGPQVVETADDTTGQAISYTIDGGIIQNINPREFGPINDVVFDVGRMVQQGPHRVFQPMSDDEAEALGVEFAEYVRPSPTNDEGDTVAPRTARRKRPAVNPAHPRVSQ